MAAQHAWLAPLAPEGASAIVYRDPGRAAELAASQGIRSADLAADGVVDYVIPETPADADRFCRDLGHALHRALQDLAHQDDDTRLAARLPPLPPPRGATPSAAVTLRCHGLAAG